MLTDGWLYLAGVHMADEGRGKHAPGHARAYFLCDVQEDLQVTTMSSAGKKRTEKGMLKALQHFHVFSNTDPSHRRYLIHA